ncbi:hypothetical protein [Chamaesiphon polymorphus]|uniref:Uncharacterized protein n=1 Tax=Chamaesiphon polymorphus CCALA 037 TaxID=2107692 RepID=A0A2T1GBS6_9CYAN|nr:hypothetical protein [Chamaesiphon polymorphus]PSB54802.1 hypothetical protein C7B77_17055 [Chamaesiphon polymorphus CCALA 037]
MTRTYRSTAIDKGYWQFKHQSIGWARVGQKELYQEERTLYQPRSRHCSMRFPHYTSTYEDCTPSSVSDKYASREQRIKYR